MAPDDLTRVRTASDPQVSPDGSRVAFVVTTLSAEKDEYLSNIWLVDASPDAPEAEPRRFTTGPKRDTFPRWSPDGTRLAFVSEREPKQKGQLYVIPAAGGEPVRLTELENGVSNPVWSPDGRAIAFLSKVGGWQEPQDEAERGKSKPARVISTFKYRLDNEGFIHDRHAHLFMVRLDPATGGASGDPVRLTHGDFNHADPVFSPGGQSIAVASARHATRDEDNAADVFLVRVVPADLPSGNETAEPRRLTDTQGPVRLPAFSPDGKHVLYLGHRHLNEGTRNMRVWSVAVDPSCAATPRCLTEDLDRTCAPFFAAFRPVWADGGRRFAFGVEDQGDIPVYGLDFSDSGLPGSAQPLMAGSRWITGLSASADGQTLAFTATDPTAPAEVFVCRGDGSGERQVTQLNRDWLAEVSLSTPERFRYERAGYTLDCWVMRPHGFQEGQRYPTLLNVHGGPATQYGHTFFDEFQVYAGAGYGVVFTNPRGSQGYGEEFMRAVLHDWGNNDYLDVMAGVDYALAKCPWIDRERLGVMGGSYGGYMTSWTVGHTDRFKAACSERALNEFSSMFGTSDIGHTFPKEHVGVFPWEDRQRHIAHSPLAYAPNVTTPLLILHSEGDLRCPIEQAEQLYVWLKKLGKDVLFVRFPDEGHEMSRSGKPRHRIERFNVILDYFGAYLQSSPPSRHAGMSQWWAGRPSP